MSARKEIFKKFWKICKPVTLVAKVCFHIKKKKNICSCYCLQTNDIILNLKLAKSKFTFNVGAVSYNDAYSVVNMKITFEPCESPHVGEQQSGIACFVPRQVDDEEEVFSMTLSEEDAVLEVL
jgi:hypothetical protein